MGAFTWEGSFATGVLKSHALSKELRYAAVADFEVAQFCRAEPGFGRKMGDTITITKIKNLTVPTSAALSEHEDIPIDTLSIGTTGITVGALGRGVEYTSLADELSFFDLKVPIQKKLKDQLAQVNDNLAADAFQTTYVCAVPQSATGITWDTDGTLSDVASHNITVAHCGVIRDYMKDTHYPSCTCIACCRRRSERAAKENWCSRHSRPKGQGGCQVCLLEGRDGRSVDNGKGGLPLNAIDENTPASRGAVNADDRGQFGKRLGRTLRGILGKRESA